jgi:hypothetical protein
METIERIISEQFSKFNGYRLTNIPEDTVIQVPLHLNADLIYIDKKNNEIVKTQKDTILYVELNTFALGMTEDKMSIQNVRYNYYKKDEKKPIFDLDPAYAISERMLNNSINSGIGFVRRIPRSGEKTEKTPFNRLLSLNDLRRQGMFQFLHIIFFNRNINDQKIKKQIEGLKQMSQKLTERQNINSDNITSLDRMIRQIKVNRNDIALIHLYLGNDVRQIQITNVYDENKNGIVDDEIAVTYARPNNQYYERFIFSLNDVMEQVILSSRI